MPDDYFDSEIEEHVDAEINSLDYHYLEWLDDVINLTIEDDDNLREIGKILAKEDKVRQAYYDFRHDDVYQDVIQTSEY